MAYAFYSEKYEILRLIGEGSFGKSYLAQNNQTKEIVVIKAIENEELWKNIQKNEHKICSINNENIMKIYGSEIIDGQRCIVQEYVSGEDLNRFIPNNDLSLEDFITISYGVFGAIEAMSTLGISHKDIKPSNIVYDKNRKVVKLIDLDYMFMLLSHTHHYVGTVKYSSPEQIIDNHATNKADVYSFGLVMCFMITGGITFDADLKKFATQAKEDVESALKNVVNLSNSSANKIKKLISRSLEYLPEKRILSSEAQRLIDDIRKNQTFLNEKSIVIHKHLDNTVYISDDTTYIEKSAMFSQSILEKTTFTTNKNSHQKSDNLVEDLKVVDKKSIMTQNIYRDELLKEYDNILLQAKVSFGLWVSSFVMCFLIIAASILSILLGNYIEGIITGVLDGAIIAIQKLFSIREDHYRELMEQKIKHLETGDYLDYAFDKVEKLDNTAEKNKEILELIKTVREHAKKDTNNA